MCIEAAPQRIDDGDQVRSRAEARDGYTLASDFIGRPDFARSRNMDAPGEGRVDVDADEAIPAAAQNIQNRALGQYQGRLDVARAQRGRHCARTARLLDEAHVQGDAIESVIGYCLPPGQVEVLGYAGDPE